MPGNIKDASPEIKQDIHKLLSEISFRGELMKIDRPCDLMVLTTETISPETLEKLKAYLLATLNPDQKVLYVLDGGLNMQLIDGLDASPRV